MKKKPTVSVVMAAHNEENNIKECLESISPIADEIIVVDSGSDDKTSEVAKLLGAKVIRTKNYPIFHINKNIAIDAAKCDWVLQMDADERVSPQLAKEVEKAVASSEFDGYWIPRKNYFLGKFLTKGGQYPDYTLRLYRRGKGRLPAKDVHEQAEVQGKVGYLKNDLMHYRDLSFTKYLEGLNRYTDLISTQIKDAGVLPNPISFIDYMLLKPLWWFVWTYFRHKGFVDGFPGFIFALFSSLRFPISYLKLWSKNNASRN